MSVQLLVDIFVGGVKQTAGSTISIDNATEAELVQNKKASWVDKAYGEGSTQVFSEINAASGGIKYIWKGSQAQYDAISVKDDSTLYVVV